MVLGPFAVVSGLFLVAIVKHFFCLGSQVLQEASSVVVAHGLRCFQT